jgi:twitching motility protein PilT
VSQRLLPRARGRGRVPAVEVLVVNARVAERILDASRVHELEDEMAHGDLYGMQTFDQSLIQLYRMGLIARSDALAHANEPAELRYELDRSDFEREAQLPPDGAVHEPGDPLSKRAVAPTGS